MSKKSTYGFRKFINDIHLWLGIASGIVIFLVCLSGTILAFEHEIKDAFSSSIEVEEQGNKSSVTQLVNTVKNSDLGFVTGVMLPSASDAPYEFSVKKDLKERRGSKVLVDPYTSEIHKVEKSKADGFLMSMFRLHRWLLLDINIGRPIVGIATIIFLVLSISGLVLWFPKKMKWKQIKQGFKIKTDAKWKRINHDLHNTLGFYSCILILIMGITGLCWSFEGYRNGLGDLIGAKIFDRGGRFEHQSDAKQEHTISIEEAIAKANETLDYDGELSVSFPDQRNSYYRFSKVAEASWSPVTSDKLYMDLSGKVLKVERFADKPLNTQIASLIKPIHTGEIYGMFSKVLYFIACLIGTSLPVTGTIIWINKLKKKNKRKKARPVLRKVA
ncbi:PepSY-associated TM helix domain-containing protein [Aestuariibaculum sp. YM273]|uniref:PepSY-associated TM helix domain-containing protein n=1 Tax=Aestuariibaculum sp. YM273 TaxID=3070659 RepID=UPI0027DC9B0C|nr:PepSY-associated TM helix domain-containing protein [Aestuariibaculum sp. YM273]WMI65764.1 PepSY-associated TM helix domain-containing protein [Aestuariibaculum sp. YM273]